MNRPVAFNQETARDLTKLVTERRRNAREKLTPRKPFEYKDAFDVIVAKAPGGGIAAGAVESCTVQEVTGAAAGLTASSRSEFVYNIWSNAVTGDATIVAIRVDGGENANSSGRFVVISEDCP